MQLFYLSTFTSKLMWIPRSVAYWFKLIAGFADYLSDVKLSLKEYSCSVDNKYFKTDKIQNLYFKFPLSKKIRYNLLKIQSNILLNSKCKIH